MTYENDKDDQMSLTNISKNMEQSLKVDNNHTSQESNIEREEIDALQQVFVQSPEYKKREIVFGQIQIINNRLSGLEEKVDEILGILKADK
jgi:hypothetical protein